MHSHMTCTGSLTNKYSHVSHVSLHSYTCKHKLILTHTLTSPQNQPSSPTDVHTHTGTHTHMQIAPSRQRNAILRLSPSNQITSMPTLTWGTCVVSRDAGWRPVITITLSSRDDQIMDSSGTIWDWYIRTWEELRIYR